MGEVDRGYEPDAGEVVPEDLGDFIALDALTRQVREGFGDIEIGPDGLPITPDVKMQDFDESHIIRGEE